MADLRTADWFFHVDVALPSDIESAEIKIRKSIAPASRCIIDRLPELRSLKGYQLVVGLIKRMIDFHLKGSDKPHLWFHAGKWRCWIMGRKPLAIGSGWTIETAWMEFHRLNGLYCAP